MKGFDHESELSPYAKPEYGVYPGIYDQTPTLLLALLEDEALEKEDVTFCIWRETTDTKWRMGDVHTSEKISDGSEFLLSTFFETPEDYVNWAHSYYDLPISIETVRQIYNGSTITEAENRILNPNQNMEDVLQELAGLIDV